MISFPEVYHKREVEKSKNRLQIRYSSNPQSVFICFCSAFVALFYVIKESCFLSDRCRALHFCNNFHLNIYAMMNLAYTIYCTGGV